MKIPIHGPLDFQTRCLARWATRCVLRRIAPRIVSPLERCVIACHATHNDLNVTHPVMRSAQYQKIKNLVSGLSHHERNMENAHVRQ